MGLKIGIDMDGVIADFIGSALKEINYLWELKLTKKDMTHPRTTEIILEHLNEKQLDEIEAYGDPNQSISSRLYEEICLQGMFLDLPVLPGSKKALKAITKTNEVIIITKPINWGYGSKEKKEWLEDHFAKLEYSVIMVDSMEAKGLIQVDIMIDDDPRVLANLDYAVPVLVEQPWNKYYRDEVVHTIKSIKEAPEKIEEVKKTLLTLEE